MPKCFLYDLLKIGSLILFFGVGGFCWFVLHGTPRKWFFTKVGRMVADRWGLYHGDMDMYNKFGKVLYGVAIFTIMTGLVTLIILVILKETKIFGVGCL